MTRLPEIKRFDATGGVRVYRIACDVSPDLSGRVYLLLGAGPPTLVDAGSGEGPCTGQILSGLEAVGARFAEAFRPDALRRILVTHGHVDHIGGLADLVAHTGAEVAAHPLERRAIEAWDERAILGTHALRRFFRHAGLPPEREDELLDAFGFRPGRVRGVAVDRLLEDGMQLDGIEVVHTPGHSPGHVCFRSGDALLCGDHILAKTVSQQWIESITPGTGLAHYFESLDRVARLDGIGAAFGGHEPPMHDLRARIDEIRETHRRRLDRVVEILDSRPEPMTAFELTERMYSRQRAIYEFLSLIDVGARIEYLDRRGRLAIANIQQIAAEPDSARRYRPA
jgi:glyoxylase-like metal-dependent hydrolase (beta-lactamase superfamily II)